MMMERLRTPIEDRVLVSPDSLRTAVEAILQTRGVSADDAFEAATVLVEADLRGVETHGVSNVVRAYLKAYDDGALNPTPKATIDHETVGTAVIDGDHGLGITQGGTQWNWRSRKPEPPASVWSPCETAVTSVRWGTSRSWPPGKTWLVFV
ncbi:MAG: Ldh family oxidoreductase [Thermomicrobiales bacterium]|nr:Ldh family oxidoreductase [Thermomicrobiales bacterium]